MSAIAYTDSLNATDGSILPVRSLLFIQNLGLQTFQSEFLI
jgi:hypothetical protein